MFRTTFFALACVATITEGVLISSTTQPEPTKAVEVKIHLATTGKGTACENELFCKEKVCSTVPIAERSTIAACKDREEKFNRLYPDGCVGVHHTEG